MELESRKAEHSLWAAWEVGNVSSRKLCWPLPLLGGLSATVLTAYVSVRKEGPSPSSQFQGFCEAFELFAF